MYSNWRFLRDSGAKVIGDKWQAGVAGMMLPFRSLLANARILFSEQTDRDRAFWSFAEDE